MPAPQMPQERVHEAQRLELPDVPISQLRPQAGTLLLSGSVDGYPVHFEAPAPPPENRVWRPQNALSQQWCCQVAGPHQCF